MKEQNSKIPYFWAISLTSEIFIFLMLLRPPGEFLNISRHEVLLWATNTCSTYLQCDHPFVSLWLTRTLIDESWFEGLNALSLRTVCLDCSPSPPRGGSGMSLWARDVTVSEGCHCEQGDVTVSKGMSLWARGCHLCAESPIPWPSRACAGRLSLCLVEKAASIPRTRWCWGCGSAGSPDTAGAQSKAWGRTGTCSCLQ